VTHTPSLLIIGASARAAAFSALRAGLRPWCADLFADADLRARCPAVRLSGRYPDGFADVLAAAPAAPWVYSGGLENHPRLVSRLARLRPLWGNDSTALSAARDPEVVAATARSAGVPAPAVRRSADGAPGGGRWLLKPLRGAGGVAIRVYSGGENEPIRASSYLQQYIEGEPRAALFVADARETRLLGVTRQLIGADWLHATPFQYCGSIGPLSLAADERAALERLGAVLTARCGLRGLFGVDGVWSDGAFWPVEVNPRYTASVEVLEFATGLAALAWHRRAFEPDVRTAEGVGMAGVAGKAILFARVAVTFPREGPWVAELRSRSAPQLMPRFADLPDAGQRIEARRPVLTFFASAAGVESCLDQLRETAAELDGRIEAAGD
jgi:predicted ATP-grasp superfamily ATP-dependent carboligase